jgi:regulator of RNase E activity RraA
MAGRDYAERDLRQRPSPEAVEQLKHYPPAFISDYLKRSGVENVTIHGLHPLVPFAEYRNHVAGPAITVQFAPSVRKDSAYEAPYMISEIVIEHVKPGDVVVVAAQHAPFGFWGEHLTHQAINSGVAAAVIDGYLRDSRPIRETAFPIFSAGITFDSYVLRYEIVGYNIPVQCGGASVRPGDVVVGDEDGCVVVPQELLGDVVAAMPLIDETEEGLRRAVERREPWSVLEVEHRKKYIRSSIDTM